MQRESLGDIGRPLSRLTLEGISIGVLLRFVSRAFAGVVSYVILVRFVEPDGVAVILALSSFLLIALQASNLGFDEAYVRVGTELYGRGNIASLRDLTMLYMKLSMLRLAVGTAFLAILDYLSGWIIPLDILVVGFIIIILRVIVKINSLIIRVFMNISLSQMIDNAVFFAAFAGTIIGAMLGSILAIVCLWATFYGAYAVVTLILSRRYTRKFTLAKANCNLGKLKNEFMEISYPLFIISVLLTLNSRIDSLFIAALEPIVTLEIIAVYLLVSRIALSIADTLRPVATTMLSSLSYAKTRDTKVFSRSLGVTLRLTLLVFFTILIAIIPISHIIIYVLFGEAYAIGSALLPIFMIIGILTVLSSLMKMISIVVGRIKLYAFILFTALAVRVSLYSSLFVLRIVDGLEISMLLAYFTLASQILLFIMIAIWFRDIFAESMEDLAKIVFIVIPFIAISEYLLAIRFMSGYALTLLMPATYLILTLRVGCLREIDLIVAQKALPKRLRWIIKIVKRIALIKN